MPFFLSPLLSAKCEAEGGAANPDSTMLRVALMGLGGYAGRVADAMQDCKKAKVTGLISGTPSKLESWGSKYGVPAASRYNYENYKNIGNNANVDAVYVITPNALHADAVVNIAQAGKHAICEKPMATSSADCRRMIDACKANGVKLLIGYRMHFEPNTLQIVQMRNEGKLGKVLFFQGLCGFHIGNPGQWRLTKELAGGGAIMDIGI